MLFTHDKTNLRLRKSTVINLNFVYYAIIIPIHLLRVPRYIEIMRLEIPYGKELLKLSIPDDLVADIIYPNDVKPVDVTQTLEKSLDFPIGTESFDSFLKDTKNLLIIINDPDYPN